MGGWVLLARGPRSVPREYAEGGVTSSSPTESLCGRKSEVRGLRHLLEPPAPMFGGGTPIWPHMVAMSSGFKLLRPTSSSGLIDFLPPGTPGSQHICFIRFLRLCDAAESLRSSVVGACPSAATTPSISKPQTVEPRPGHTHTQRVEAGRQGGAKARRFLAEAVLEAHRISQPLKPRSDSRPD